MNSKDQVSPRGALIVVEGLDRAGKTSQCQLLLEALRAGGYTAKYVKFPGMKFEHDLDILAEAIKTERPQQAK
jgi:thymidylate kinase